MVNIRGTCILHTEIGALTQGELLAPWVAAAAMTASGISLKVIQGVFMVNRITAFTLEYS